MDETSASLLERLRSPTDSVAWSRFSELYDPLLRRWLARYNVPHHDANDVAQEVLAVVARDMPEFRYDPQRGAFRGWLRTILTKQLQAYWRRKRAQPLGLDDSDWQNRLAELEDPASPASARWDQEYGQQVARRALACIQNEFEFTSWQAFWRVVVDGHPAADVARELGISRNAVYIAKSRVLERLKQELAGLLE